MRERYKSFHTLRKKSKQNVECYFHFVHTAHHRKPTRPIIYLCIRQEESPALSLNLSLHMLRSPSPLTFCLGMFHSIQQHPASCCVVLCKRKCVSWTESHNFCALNSCNQMLSFYFYALILIYYLRGNINRIIFYYFSVNGWICWGKWKRWVKNFIKVMCEVNV